jgi:drug/metabolite transporter (DMT)-like permease
VKITTYVILAIAVLAQATGNVFLSKGMKHIALTSRVMDGAFLVPLLQIVQNPMIWMGTLLMIIFFLLFLTVLSKADLSFVLPVISIEVVVNVAFAGYFLNEPVSAARWMGTMLISLGVILVFRSEQQAVRERNESLRVQDIRDR